jgi:ATP-dependent protease ClpP protease subunit
MIPQPSNLAALRAAWRAAGTVPNETVPCFQLSTSTQSAKLYVSGVIGGFDLDATEFVQAVHALDVKQIDLHINSPGGFVWDTVAMYEALRAHPATVTTHVDGLAASAASFLALAGDTVQTAKASRWMIHDAQVVAIGSPADIREAADIGDAVSNDIAGIYADRAGGKPAAWRKAMTATTWYSAQQAVDAGLADRVATKHSGPDNRSRLIQARHRALTTRGVK